MLYNVRVIVGATVIGAVTRGPTVIHGETQPPASQAFFCPVCAEVWGRVAVQKAGADHYQQFMVWTRPCQQHTADAHGIPGSLLLPWDKTFNDALPLAAWRREVILHCDHYLQQRKEIR